ncbi:MAG TPA: hypothetical protein VNN79_12150 [Actinomycetota bacterium]|nr:hypothetical protein [Actinomycetota bacterium]
MYGLPVGVAEVLKPVPALPGSGVEGVDTSLAGPVGAARVPAAGEVVGDAVAPGAARDIGDPADERFGGVGAGVAPGVAPTLRAEVPAGRLNVLEPPAGGVLGVAAPESWLEILLMMPPPPAGAEGEAVPVTAPAADVGGWTMFFINDGIPPLPPPKRPAAVPATPARGLAAAPAALLAPAISPDRPGMAGGAAVLVGAVAPPVAGAFATFCCAWMTRFGSVAWSVSVPPMLAMFIYAPVGEAAAPNWGSGTVLANGLYGSL